MAPASAPVQARDMVPVWTLGAGAAVVLAILGLLGWKLHWFGGEGQPAAVPTVATRVMQHYPTSEMSTEPSIQTTTPMGSTTPSEASSPTVPARTASPRELRDAAFASIEQLVADDAKLSPIRGQWVAQLSSKTEGIVDKSQQATPFTLPEILAEITSLKKQPDYGSLVRVVHQGDWGKSTAGPNPMWVAFADIDVASKAEVVAWCQNHFTKRGSALLNVCYPRQMHPK